MDPCNNVKKPKYMHLQWDLDLKKKKKLFKRSLEVKCIVATKV